MRRTRRGRPPLDRDDPESVSVCVRVSPAQYNDLYARAQAERVNIPELIRRSLPTNKELKNRRNG